MFVIQGFNRDGEEAWTTQLEIGLLQRFLLKLLVLQ
jgi:hypothetical protein